MANLGSKLLSGIGKIGKAVGKGVLKSLDVNTADIFTDHTDDHSNDKMPEINDQRKDTDTKGNTENPNPSGAPKVSHNWTPFPAINYPKGNVDKALEVIAKESNRRINLVKKESFDSIYKVAVYSKNINDAVVKANKRITKVEATQKDLLDSVARLKQNVNVKADDKKPAGPVFPDTKEKKKEEDEKPGFDWDFLTKLKPGLGATAKTLAQQGGRKVAAKGIFGTALKSGRVVAGAALGGIVEGGMEYLETGNAKKAATVGVGAGLGGWGGAAAGAAVGTFILPGVGTTIGSIIGGIAGSYGGGAISRSGYDMLTNRNSESPTNQPIHPGFGPIDAGKNLGLLTNPEEKEPKRHGPIDMLANLFGKKKEAEPTENTEEFKLKRTWITIEATTGDLELKAKRALRISAEDRLYLNASEIFLNGVNITPGQSAPAIQTPASAAAGGSTGTGSAQGPNIPGTDIGRQGGASGMGGLGLGIRNGPGGGARTPGARSFPSKDVKLSPENFKSMEEFRQKWGMSREALLGTLKIESGLRTNLTGGAGGNYHGIFQLGGNQIPGLTKAVFGRSMSAEEYKNLSMVDQLKVMDMYYQKNGIKPGFFTGDETDKAKMWAMQLAPGNAKKINYNDPNAIISSTKQAGIIMGDGGVTVGSAIKGTTTASQNVKLPEEATPNEKAPEQKRQTDPTTGQPITLPGEQTPQGSGVRPGSKADQAQKMPPEEYTRGIIEKGRQIGGIGHEIGPNTFAGLCGKGARGMSGALFNSSYFSQGLGSGGNSTAGSLSRNNNYLQKSGLYNERQGIDKKQLSQEYLNSLPVGTVISSEGGGRGGHVQTKIAPGKWVSDSDQGNRVLTGKYYNFAVHTPNENGIQRLDERARNDPATIEYAKGMGVQVGSGNVTARNERPQDSYVQGSEAASQLDSILHPKKAAPTPPVTPNTPAEQPKSLWEKTKSFVSGITPTTIGKNLGILTDPDKKVTEPSSIGPFAIGRKLGLFSDPSKKPVPPDVGPIAAGKALGVLSTPPTPPVAPVAPMPTMLQPRPKLEDTLILPPKPKGPYGGLAPLEKKRTEPTFIKKEKELDYKGAQGSGPHRPRDWKARAHNATSGRTSHHPEQSPPSPGDNGYGQKCNEDGVGLCSV